MRAGARESETKGNAMSIKDKLDQEYAESWKPTEAGEELIGKVVEFGQRTTEWGTHRIITVETEDGTQKAFHAFHMVAKEQLESAAPALGDEIGIRYLGRKSSAASASGYENYKIVVDHPPGWSPPMQAVPSQPEAPLQPAEDDAGVPF